MAAHDHAHDHAGHHHGPPPDPARALLIGTSLKDADAIERLDRRAHQLVGWSLFALAAWVVFDASKSLWLQERPEPSVVGMVMLALSIAAMYWLAKAKRRAAAALKSRALQADSFQTSACFWLSVVGLAGVSLNAAFGFWWAYPVAALGIAVLLVKEGRESLRGESCCDGVHCH